VATSARIRARLPIVGAAVVIAVGIGLALTLVGRDKPLSAETARQAAATARQALDGSRPSVAPIDLGTLGGRHSQAVAVNNRGQVVGTSATAGSRGTHAFLWQRGVMTDLGTLGGSESRAVAVNDRGQVVGTSSTASGQYHAFIWQDGAMTDLGVLPGTTNSKAAAINERGQVVGDSDDRAFLWEHKKMTDLGALPGGDESSATAINDHGQVVGVSSTGLHDEVPFLWQNGVMARLGAVDDDRESQAIAINDRGQVIGNWGDRAVLWQGRQTTYVVGLGGHCCELGGINSRGQVLGTGYTLSRRTHAFIWQRGTMTDLGSLEGRAFSVGVAINDLGQVIGYGTSVDGQMNDAAPFLWQDGKMTTLGALSGGSRSGAVAINDRGQAVGYSYTDSGAEHAVIWNVNY
jgi:probable HAF family extracellular repeat protein